MQAMQEPTLLVTLPRPGTIIDETIDESPDEAFENLWRVIIHNDNFTPFEYVYMILETIFMLSSELVEHIAWTAHERGQAVVVIRPRSEAERLVDVAMTRARLDGFPLTFTLEEED